MAPRSRITVTQTQRLQLNTSLQAAIQMLRADAAGLTRYLEEQADQNPHLRLDPAAAPAPGEWLPRWSGVIGGVDAGDKAAQTEGPAASLMAHVTSEIRRLVTSPRDRAIALGLAEALEPSGWLGRDLSAIAAEVGASLAEVEAVLTQVQRIDPAGLFARNLAECLALQLTDAGAMDGTMAVILSHLGLLGSGGMGRLARLAHTTEADITKRFRVIRGLDPKPGTRFAGFAAPPVREPDLLARREDGGAWTFSLNRSSLPSLRIVDEGARDPAGLAAARAVARMVVTRNQTLLRVGREVLTRQRAALDQGPQALMPMTMAEVAETLGLHESTISRVVAGVSVDTPRGTWWLRRLFSGRLGVEGGPQFAGAAVQARLERLVAAEAANAPLSDAALAAALAEGGPEIARRTVAKYRAVLNIPPAHRRRRRGEPPPKTRRKADNGA